MSERAPTPKEIEEASALLARACREVRQNPELFEDGFAFIEREFSVEGVARRAEAMLAEFTPAADGSLPVLAKAYQEDRDAAPNALWRIGTAKTWACKQNMAMSRAEAQAVVLISGWLYDDDPDWNAGLPALFDRWVVEYWKGAPAEFRDQRSGEQREVLRLLRYELTYNDPYRDVLVHSLRLAFDRIHASAPAPEPAVESYVTLDNAAALSRRSKRTLQRWVEDGKLPPACVPGGHGKPALWRWKPMRAALMKIVGMNLPTRFPGSQILDDT